MKPKIKFIYENIHSLTLRIIEEAKISINSFINYNTRERCTAAELLKDK